MVLTDFRLAADLVWDRANEAFYDSVEAKSGDVNGRGMRVQVKNDGAVEDLTGFALNLGWETQDNFHSGLDAFTPIDLSQGLFEIAFTTGMLKNAGKLTATLQLVGPDSIVESVNFLIIVRKSPVDGETQQSSNSFGTLETMLINVQNVIDDATANENARIAEYGTLVAGYDQTLNNLLDVQGYNIALTIALS